MRKSKSGARAHTQNQDSKYRDSIDNRFKNKKFSEFQTAEMNRKGSFINENNSLTIENLFSTINSKQLKLKNGSDLRENTCSPMVDEVGKLDELDKQILKLLVEDYHCRLLAKTLKQPQSTIQYRLKRLQKNGLIIDSPGVYNTKLYRLTSRSSELLIHNESHPSLMPFTAHCMSFKFPILEGNQPKSHSKQKMKNWESYIFSFSTYTIKTTTKHIIVFINQDLGADSIDNLNLKYSELAQTYASKFAKEHNITIGGISRYREGHFTIKDSALGQIISERGEFRTQSGIMIDKSRSSGDLEMLEDSARSFEFAFNILPALTAGLHGEMRGVSVKLEALSSTLADIQVRLQLDAENSPMISHMKKAVETLSMQAEEMQSQLLQQEEKSNLTKACVNIMYG